MHKLATQSLPPLYEKPAEVALNARPKHHHHAYHGVAFTSIRSIAYAVSFAVTPEIKDPKLRLLARAAIVTGAGFLERELWRRGAPEPKGHAHGQGRQS